MRRTTHDTGNTASTDSTGAAPAASAATPPGARRSMGRLLLTAVGIALLAAAPACAAAPPATTPPAPGTAKRIPVVSCRHGHPREAPSTSHCRLRTVVLDVPIR